MASHGNFDHGAGPICVDLLMVPVWVVCVPLAVLPARLIGVARSLHLPVGPASEAGARAAVCLMGAAAFGVDMTGSSLPACPLVATILVLSKSSFKDCLQVTIKSVEPHYP